MEYSYANVEAFDKELKIVTLSITELMSNLGELSKRVGHQLQFIDGMI